MLRWKSCLHNSTIDNVHKNFTAHFIVSKLLTKLLLVVANKDTAVLIHLMVRILIKVLLPLIQRENNIRVELGSKAFAPTCQSLLPGTPNQQRKGKGDLKMSTLHDTWSPTTCRTTTTQRAASQASIQHRQIKCAMSHMHILQCHTCTYTQVWKLTFMSAGRQLPNSIIWIEVIGNFTSSLKMFTSPT